MPQEGQSNCNGVAQALQNFAPAGLACRHWGHCKEEPLIKVSVMSDRPSAWDGRDVAPEDSGVLWLGGSQSVPLP